jgi:hypothetical protein
MNDENKEPEDDDEIEEDEVRDTWKNHVQTIAHARMLRESLKNALRALVHAAKNSSDPDVRGMSTAYETIKQVAKKLDGVDGKKVRLP